MRLLIVVNLFDIFLYFVVLHEDLKVQRLELYLQAFDVNGLLLLRVRGRVFLLLRALRGLLEGFLGVVRVVVRVLEAEDETYCVVVV